MKHIIPIAALAALAAIAWHVGGMIPAHTMTVFFGFLFGAFVGIPAMLIIAKRAQTVRHDHYVHTPTEAPREPQKQPVQLTAKPTSYIVIGDRAALPTSTHNKIEVKR